MKNVFISKVLGAVMGILPLAGSIKSPNGNIELKFSVDEKGRRL